MKLSLAIGLFFFVIFGYYSYGFYTGSYLITKQVHNSNNNDEPYTIGDILSCFFGIVFGVLSLGMTAPNIKAIAEGKVAGKMAYDVIDRKPKIMLDDPTSSPVEDISGQIEFRNVTFSYPTRKE
jgi:ABC-type multidrug transport system fused ATPase/permease subunit